MFYPKGDRPIWNIKIYSKLSYQVSCLIYNWPFRSDKVTNLAFFWWLANWPTET